MPRLSAEGGDSESGHKGGNKAKRVRTTFTEEQLSVLQANFQLDSNPDGQDLERIAHVTGLSKRVTQVWFQNSRARQKKHLHTGKMKGQHGNESIMFNQNRINFLAVNYNIRRRINFMIFVVVGTYSASIATEFIDIAGRFWQTYKSSSDLFVSTSTTTSAGTASNPTESCSL